MSDRSTRFPSPHPPGDELMPDVGEVADYTKLARLDNLVYIVAGGGNGMGRRTCHALAQHGGSVVCVDYEADRSERVAAEVGGLAVTADVRDADDVARVVDVTVERYGRIDGVVDIVGLAVFESILDTTDDQWGYSLDMNLRHAFLMLRHAAPVMARNGGGSFTYLSSIDGLLSAPNHIAYGVAKAGLLSLVRTACVELGSQGIRANAICPGPTKTPRVLALTGGTMPGSRAEGGIMDHPLGAVNEMDDVVAALLFMASPMSRMVSGQFLAVDGGGTQQVYDLSRLPS